MITTAATPVLDPFIIQQAEICASRMVGNYGFTPDEWEDLRQELVLEYLERLPLFDASRGELRGFGYGVVRNRAVKLAVRRCKAIATGEVDGRRVHRTVSRADAELEARIAIQTAVSRLPNHLQSLARLLSEMRIGEICRQTGKSRRRIHQLVRQIRDAFIEYGVTQESIGRQRGVL
jgi:RNA polymerase sigma-70 factor, ECF subfamily